MSDFPAGAFSLDHRPDLGILIGRWLRNLPPPELQATYRVMLEEARAHSSCRYWLLDLRRRPVTEVDLNVWISEQFTPVIATDMGGALFTAFLVGPDQQAAIESEHMSNYLRQLADLELYPNFFDNEADAVTWLADLRERAGGR
ncbi:hypothetical protein GCM10023185_04920 [Hymenobacter saemangeumensis]|uniref:STAS/SEC14 domain-containing protein n=1 Tax=Hymenobacter saemangeumensis TaxID=1084522 RepID=A0ABP8I0J9_9BACT